MSNLEINWDIEPDSIISCTNNLIERSVKINNQLCTYTFLPETNPNHVKKLVTFLNMLANDISEIQVFHSMCGFLQYTYPLESTRNASFTADLLLTKHIENLNLKKPLYTNILKAKQIAQNIMKSTNKIDLIDIKFLDVIISSYEKNGINLDSDHKKMLIKVKYEIAKLENSIIKYLSDGETQIMEIMKKDFDKMPISIQNQMKFAKPKTDSNSRYTIFLNKNNFSLGLKYLSNEQLRKRIEAKYIGKYDKIITNQLFMISRSECPALSSTFFLVH